RKYVENDLRSIYKGSVFYCQDAFEGLATLDRLLAGDKDEEGNPSIAREASKEDTGYDEVRVTTPAPGGDGSGLPAGAFEYVESDVRSGEKPPVPKPPFWGSRVVRGIPLRDIFPWINEIALFCGQWQYQKGKRSDAEYAAFVDNEVRPVFR